MAGARTNVITWDEAFMGAAELIRQRSKDPSTQVGACVVTADNRILSLGYNGTPNGYEDDDFPWVTDSEILEEKKYPYVIHAERNALANYAGSRREFAGGTVYVTHYPCNECAKEIVQAGLKKVIYLLPYANKLITEVSATERIFAKTGVTLEQMELTPYLKKLQAIHED